LRAAILDTDILSYVTDKRYPEVDATARQYLKVFRCFSVAAVTVSEMIKGITRKPDHSLELKEFLNEAETFEVFPLFREEAILAGQILGALLGTGKQIGPLDPFIAATAIENKRILVTNNTKHYQRIIDLGFQLEMTNWRNPERL
jgi:tRNA(fMet)-specific endonuclease VapC